MGDSDEFERASEGDRLPSPADATPDRNEIEPNNDPERIVPEAPPSPLLGDDDAEAFRSRWSDIQAGFVDEPRKSVEAADGLVAEVIQEVAEGFAQERSGLEGQWERGEDVSTEDLRVALQRYRSFFERLLSAQA